MENKIDLNLYDRVLDEIKHRRERVLSGKVNCIPWGFPRFEMENPGIEQGRYYICTANQKVTLNSFAKRLLKILLIN